MFIKLSYRSPFRSEEPKKFFSKVITIGRPFGQVPDLDLTPDDKVSRQHARLEYKLGTWWVEDLNSTNGTFVNGKRITCQTELSPGDQLKLGDTDIRVEFISLDPVKPQGAIEIEYPVYETQALDKVSEDLRLKLFCHISQITTKLQGQQMLDAFLDELFIVFPKAESWTIALIEDAEIIPMVYKPKPGSKMSNYLARRAILSQQAFLWTRNIDLKPGESHISSLVDVTSAIYAPIIFCKQVVGVVYVGTTSLENFFTAGDLLILSEIANMIGPAIRASQSESFERLNTVFISYEKSDRKWVERLAGNLRRRSIKVFFDERIVSGSERSKEIKKVIRTIDAFLLVCPSKEKDTSLIVKEMELAKAFKKYIIPLQKFPGIKQQLIGDFQPINMSENEYSNGIQKLAEVIVQLPKFAPKTEESQVKILFLAANPLETQQLRLDEEVREIDECLRRSELRDRFELISHWAVRYSDVAELLLRHQPHIVHFSGHGSKKGEIVLENRNGEAHPVSANVLGELFRILKENTSCIVLNACWSAKQARAISKEINCVVGMSKSMEDKAAIQFSGAFYQALGYGRSVQDAFDLGRVAIDLSNNHSESLKPKLITRTGVRASDVTFE